MKRLVLLALLASSFLAGLVAFAPLGVVLKASGAEARGLGWTQAEGTLLSGKVTGLVHEDVTYGDAELNFAPGGLLTANLQYTVNWTGPQGAGRGKVSAGPGGQVTLHDYSVGLDLSQLEQAALWIRQSGGRLDLSGTLLRIGPEGCIRAEGTARTDVLERNQDILGPGWAPMQGALRCEAGALVIPMASENQSGTRFLANLSLAPQRPGQFEARVSGLIPRELAFALPIAGFTPQGQDFVYLYSTPDTSAPE